MGGDLAPRAADAVASEGLATDMRSATGRTPYVGAVGGTAVLRQAVDRAMAGAGGVALIAGEAGLGKTRLVDEIAARGEGARACSSCVGIATTWRALRPTSHS